MRNYIVVAAIFFLGVGASQIVTFFSSQKSLPLKSSASLSSSASPSASVQPTGALVQAVVKRVIDGDTIELTDGKKVRYIGMDTPETVHPEKPVQCFGKEASEENKRLVEGQTIRLEKDVSETDRYGRLLRYVYLDGIMVNDTLVRQGFAYASTYPPDVKYQDQFSTAQKEARENMRGLWKSCQGNEKNTTNGTNTTNTTNQTNNPMNVTSTPAPQVQGQSVERSTGTACLIKGNISAKGDKIYHLPGCGSYDKTSIDESVGEKWFCSEDEAQKAGWRKAKNC